MDGLKHPPAWDYTFRDNIRTPSRTIQVFAERIIHWATLLPDFRIKRRELFFFLFLVEIGIKGE